MSTGCLPPRWSNASCLRDAAASVKFDSGEPKPAALWTAQALGAAAIASNFDDLRRDRGCEGCATDRLTRIAHDRVLRGEHGQQYRTHAATPDSCGGGAAARVAASSPSIRAHTTLMLGQKLIEARPSFRLARSGLAQLLRPGQRNDVACPRAQAGYDTTSALPRVTVAPDQARMTGDALAASISKSTPSGTKAAGASNLIFAPIMLKLRTTAGDGRAAVIERDHSTVVERAVPGPLTPLQHDPPPVPLTVWQYYGDG